MRTIFLASVSILSICILPSFPKVEAQVSPVSFTVPNITRQLYMGISGADVTSLQLFLKERGYFIYPTVTTYYGAVTSKAVAAFQLANGIEAIGIVGPQTRAKIKQISTSGVGGTVSPVVAPVAVNSVVRTHRTGTMWIETPTPTPVKDTLAPSVSIISPLNNATASGSAVVLAANASDNVAIAGVQFKVDGVNVGLEDTSAPYSVTWNSSAISFGTSTITAVARDTSNNLATSSGVSVGVDNGIVYGNFSGYKANSPYSTYASFWYLYTDPTLGLGHTAVENVDYVSQVKVYPSTFPDNTKMIWRVPTPAYGGIYGYLTASYGNYDYSDPTVSITPRQVYTITDLTSTIDFSYTGDATTGVLHEFWLSTTSHQTGPITDKVAEIGMFARTSPATITFVTGSTQVGSFTDPGGRIWTVARNTSGTGEPYYMFMPTNHADVTGTVYWDEMLAYLIGQGKITGNEWFNGIAIGPEPYTGAGTVTILDYDVSYAGAARVPWTISNLSGTAQSDTQVLLSFFPAAGATSHQYRINGGSWVSMPGNFTVTGLTASTAYNFEVRGVNSTGNGAASNLISVTTQSPGATNIITNGDFSASDTDWGGFWYSGKSVAGGKATFASTPAYDDINHALVLTAGKYYDVTYTLVRSAGAIFPQFGGGTQRNGTVRSTSGTFTDRLLVNTGNNMLHFLPHDFGFSGTIDDVTVVGPYNTP